MRRELDRDARSEGRRGGAQPRDLLYAVRAVTAAIGTLSMQDEFAGACPPERVGLDQAGAAVVVQLDEEVVRRGKPN